MSYIIWTEELSVNNQELDNQHQFILKKINDYYEKMLISGSINYLEILNFLEEYALVHFSSEEELMIKKNYPDFLEHQEVHNKYKLKLQELRKEIINNHLDSSKELLSFLKNWWIGHINSQDHKYKSYMLK